MAISEKAFYWIMAGAMFIIGSSLIVYEPAITANVTGASAVDSSTVTLIGLAFIIVGFLLFVLIYTSKHQHAVVNAPDTGMGTAPGTTLGQAPQTVAPIVPQAPAATTVNAVPELPSFEMTGATATPTFEDFQTKKVLGTKPARKASRKIPSKKVIKAVKKKLAKPAKKVSKPKKTSKKR